VREIDRFVGRALRFCAPKSPSSYALLLASVGSRLVTNNTGDANCTTVGYLESTTKRSCARLTKEEKPKKNKNRQPCRACLIGLVSVVCCRCMHADGIGGAIHPSLHSSSSVVRSKDQRHDPFYQQQRLRAATTRRKRRSRQSQPQR